MILRSVRNRLAALFFVITAAAIGFIYLYVVPQLSSRLTAQKLERLERVGNAESQPLALALRNSAPPLRLRRLVRGISEATDARVTLLELRAPPSGSGAATVVADSAAGPRAPRLDFSIADRVAAGNRSSSGVVRVGERGSARRLFRSREGVGPAGSPCFPRRLPTSTTPSP